LLKAKVKTMNKTADFSTLPTPTHEEIAFYIREGKRLQSVAVHNMLKTSYRTVVKAFSMLGSEQQKPGGEPANPLSGYHLHGN